MSNYGQFPQRNAPIRAFDGKASVMTQNRQVKEAATIRLHSKTFSAWVNVHLRKKQLRVNDITKDFSDGILLIQLIEILSNQTCNMKYNTNPKLEIQKVENVAVAIKFINNFTRVNINPKDVVSGNAKVILAILWRLIIAFQMPSPNPSNSNSSSVAMKREVKNKLLGWIREKTGINVTDCDRSFDNGVIFCHLLHSYDSSLINLARVNPNQPRDNLEIAFQFIEEHLKIPRMLSVDDMQNPDISSRPDEQCIMTYLFQFPEAFLQRPTPKAISPNIELQSLPTNIPSYINNNTNNINQNTYSQVDSGSSTASHPTTEINSFSESRSNFPQLPNQEPKRNTRYQLPDNVPLPPSVSATKIDNLTTSPSPANNSPAINHSPSPSPSSSVSNNSPVINHSSSPINSGVQSLGGNNNNTTTIPSYLQTPSSNTSHQQITSNQPNQSDSPYNSMFNNSNNYSSQSSYNNQDSQYNQSPSFNNNNRPSNNDSLSTNSPSNLQNRNMEPNPSLQNYSSLVNQPQRPPPPSTGFSDFMTPTGNIPVPQRPPPPSTDFFNTNPSQNNINPNQTNITNNPIPSNNPMPMQSNPNPNLFNNNQPQIPSNPPPSDWQQKELELKQREEAFNKQQEEFRRQKEEYERELERLRKEAEMASKNTQQVPQQQSSVYKLIVGIVAARNLIPGSITGHRNPYAIAIVDNQRERTTVLKKTITPQWNVDFTFYVENPNWSVNVTIYDKNKLKHDDFLGKVNIPIKQLQEGVLRDEWITLQPKKAGGNVSGEIRLKFLITR